jgi:proteasome lid subunit RPN8/RPN11
MPRRSDRKSSRQAPLYIRWAPFRSAYAIELRLDLVAQLLAEIERAAAAGLEVGGVLVGSFPNAQTPTLRIEEIELMARRPENGAVYVPHPDTHRHMHEIRLRAQRRNRAVVGFFRSHARSAPLVPSITDRSLVSEELAQGVYALLLIEARAPHFAAFFLSAGGQVPEEPSTREFVLDEGEFKALPEIRPAAAINRGQETKEASKLPFYAVLAIGLLAVVALFAWAIPRDIGSRWPGTTADQLGLVLTAADHLIRISWNHSARAISGAQGATILIVDGTARHEIKIGPDELRLGTVDYQRTAPRVDVTMTLDNAGANVSPQSATWTEK